MDYFFLSIIPGSKGSALKYVQAPPTLYWTAGHWYGAVYLTCTYKKQLGNSWPPFIGGWNDGTNESFRGRNECHMSCFWTEITGAYNKYKWGALEKNRPPTRLELATSVMLGQRSNQLSHGALMCWNVFKHQDHTGADVIKLVDGLFFFYSK